MEALNHIFYFNMGLNCPTEVVSQFSIFSPNTPLRDHCAPADNHQKVNHLGGFSKYIGWDTL